MDNPKTEQRQRDETDVKQPEQTEKVSEETSLDPSAQGNKAKKSSVKAEPQCTNNVKQFRMERMMSKAELARRAQLSALTIDRVEKSMPCRMDTKRKILEALGLTPMDRVAVFGEED